MKRVGGALLLGAAALAAALLLAGCDIPTAAPIVEQRWILTAAETTLGVEDLLPDGRVALAVSDSLRRRRQRVGERRRERSLRGTAGLGPGKWSRAKDRSP